MAKENDPAGKPLGAPVSAFAQDSLESSSLQELEEHGLRTTVLAAFPSAVEAAMARSRLEADGIDADLVDEHTVSIGPHLALAVGGVKVRVLEQDAERAREILASLGDFPLPDGDEEEEPDDGLAEAGDEPPDRLASRALAAGIVGAVFFPPLNLWSLWLLFRALRDEEPLSGKGKRNVALALAFDSLALVWLLFLLPR